MATTIIKDFPHFTVSVLLSALKQPDHQNLRECSHAVLRSSFNHLFLSNFTEPDEATGLAMSHLLILCAEHRT